VASIIGQPWCSSSRAWLAHRSVVGPAYQAGWPAVFVGGARYRKLNSHPLMSWCSPAQARFAGAHVVVLVVAGSARTNGGSLARRASGVRGAALALRERSSPSASWSSRGRRPSVSASSCPEPPVLVTPRPRCGVEQGRVGRARSPGDQVNPFYETPPAPGSPVERCKPLRILCSAKVQRLAGGWLPAKRRGQAGLLWRARGLPKLHPVTACKSGNPRRGPRFVMPHAGQRSRVSTTHNSRKATSGSPPSVKGWMGCDKIFLFLHERARAKKEYFPAPQRDL
jgi:hypothetical protein